MAKVQKGQTYLDKSDRSFIRSAFLLRYQKENLPFVISTYVMKSIAYTQERYNARFGFLRNIPNIENII